MLCHSVNDRLRCIAKRPPLRAIIARNTSLPASATATRCGRAWRHLASHPTRRKDSTHARRASPQTTAGSGSSAHTDLQELIDWLRNQGAVGLDNVDCVAQPSGERGLAARQTFRKEDTIFCLPLECAICDWPGNNDETLPDGPSSVRLAVLLLRRFADAGLPIPAAAAAAAEPPGPGPPQNGHPPQRPQQRDQGGTTSPGTSPPRRGTTAAGSAGAKGCGPYLNTLPPRPPAMLFAFRDPADLAWLEYPPLERAILSYRDLAAHHYSRCGGAGTLGGASLEQFTWALSIVGSRCLGTSLLLLALLAGGGSGDGSGGRGVSDGSGDGSGDHKQAREASTRKAAPSSSSPPPPPPPPPPPSSSSWSSSSSSSSAPRGEPAGVSEASHGSPTSSRAAAAPGPPPASAATPPAPACPSESTAATTNAAASVAGEDRGGPTAAPDASPQPSSAAATPLVMMALYQMAGLSWVPSEAATENDSHRSDGGGSQGGGGEGGCKGRELWSAGVDHRPGADDPGGATGHAGPHSGSTGPVATAAASAPCCGADVTAASATANMARTGGGGGGAIGKIRSSGSSTSGGAWNGCAEDPVANVTAAAAAAAAAQRPTAAASMRAAAVAGAAGGFDDGAPFDGPGGGAGGSGGRVAATGGQLRMLVPLLDLINHGSVRRTGARPYGRDGCGREPECIFSDANVRWELRPPSSVCDPMRGCDNNGRDSAGGGDDGGSGGGGGGDGAGGDGAGGGGGWRVALVAVADLPAGQELLLCYDATATNDAFALHYGFLPQYNSYDDVQLYDNLEEALAWTRCAEVLAAATVTSSGSQGQDATKGSSSAPLSADALAALYQGATAAAAAAAAAAATRSGAAADLSAPIKLHAGGPLCPLLAAAFRHLALAAAPEPPPPPPLQAADGAAPASIGAAEDEDKFRAPDLCRSGDHNHSHNQFGCEGHGSGSRGDGSERNPNPDQQVAEAVARRCVELLGLRVPLLADLEMLIRDDELRRRQQQQQQQDAEEQQQQPARPAAKEQCSRWRELLRHYAESLSGQAPDLQDLAGLARPAVRAAVEGRDLPVGRSRPAEPEVAETTTEGGYSDGDDDGDCGDDDAQVGRPLAEALTPQRRLALEYRVRKKVLLWDHVLAVGGCQRRA